MTFFVSEKFQRTYEFDTENTCYKFVIKLHPLVMLLQFILLCCVCILSTLPLQGVLLLVCNSLRISEIDNVSCAIAM